MSNRAEIQDSQYAFPYHYLPTLGSDGFSETRHLFWGYEYASYLEYILDLLGEKPFSSYLDIGCGEGRLTHEVHKKFPNVHVLGTDFSERAIAFARAFTPDVSFETTRNEVLIAQGRTFDRITLVEVLEHIPPEEIPAFLTEFSTLLTPNGMGIITVPSATQPVNPKHYQHFTEESLRKTLELHFKVISINFLNADTVGEKILRRCFANGLFILNNQKLNSLLYAFYRKQYMVSDSKKAKRLVACVAPLPSSTATKT